MYHLKIEIERFIKSKLEHPDFWLIHSGNQSKLADAIVFAALAENHLGKRHPHQYRRSGVNLEKFANRLLGQINQIENANCFDNLLNTVEKCKVTDVGPLTFYDTATRIGAFLKLYPDKVYLHSGTRIGAESILGRKIKSAFIDRSDLPEVFQDSRLSCADLEDILCHLKKVPVEVKNREMKLGIGKKHIC